MDGMLLSLRSSLPHLLQDILDAALLLLVRVKDLEELLVDLWLVRKALLDGRDVGDGVVEVDRLVGLARLGSLLPGCR